MPFLQLGNPNQGMNSNPNININGNPNMMNVNMYGQIPTNQNPNMGNYQKGYY
jgi:hypothetical protein